METALGGSIQNIVSDTEDTAKKMISYLKQNKFGRATFLPLTTVKNYGGFPKPEALKEEGVIGTADRLAKTDPRFQEIASSLLGRTLVVDHIDHGTRIARKYKLPDIADDHILREPCRRNTAPCIAYVSWKIKAW